jgi:hypothetical protein
MSTKCKNNNCHRQAYYTTTCEACLVMEVQALRTVLFKLARLGNEPHFGNSLGNDIARAALEEKED